MRAILLAAGLGTRLRPLTDTVPKCLVEIKGQPLLGIWLKNLTRAGIGPFLINTHHLAEKVTRYVRTSDYADQISIEYEPELRGTAGTLIANLGFFRGEDGLLIHADNYCNPDFSEFMRAHQERPAECVMTMMTFRTDNPSACGIVELDDRGVVMRFHEKVQNPPGDIANGAVYILSGSLLQTLAAKFQRATDFSTEILPAFLGKICTYEATSIYLDIGTPESYFKAGGDIMLP